LAEAGRSPGTRFAQDRRDVEEEVLQVDPQAGTLTVRARNGTFSSLSAATASITGQATNLLDLLGPEEAAVETAVNAP
jgi:hypothetical protein